jgi:hypothetical protein
VFPPRSVDTTLTFALTHEIWSYGAGLTSVRRFAEAIYQHTVPGGVWLNSDVCGPAGLDRPVRLRLRTDDGANPAAVRADLDALDAAGVQRYVAGLSTRARLDQFCGLAFDDWVGLLTAVGFDVDPASRPWRNDWIVANRLAPVAALTTTGGDALDWPDTHVRLVARRPHNS